MVTPNGGTQDVFLNLEVKDGAVTGVVFGFPVTGKVEGETVTLSMAIPGRPGPSPVLTGQMTGDQILFRAVGFEPVPLQFVARRDPRFAATAAYPIRRRWSAS